MHLLTKTVQLFISLACMLAAQALVLTPEQKIEALDVHNRLRRSVYPPAADMNLLTWNPRLEQLAQQAANSCVLAHNYAGPFTGLGENIYKGQRTNATEIVSLFFAEQAAFDYLGGGVCNTGRQQNTFGAVDCGHYIQVVAANAAEVGCAIANCSATDLMVVCEYDVMYATPLPYTQGQPCSRCRQFRTFCANGLCANYTAAANATGNATCSLRCMNCGTLVDLGPTACACVCPSGFIGPNCNERTSATAAPPSDCTACRARATPCRNGSNETSGGPCKCACPPEFRGPQCDIPRDAYDHGLLVSLRGPQICMNGKCGQLPPPMDPMQFRQRVWPPLSSALAAAVNGYCGTNATTFAHCCGNATNATFAGGNGGGRALVQPGDFGFIEASLAVGANADMTVAVFATAPLANSMCSGGPTPAPPGRRRRDVAASPVTYSVLTASVLTFNASVSANLTSCCSVTVSTLQEYRVVADAATDTSGAVTTVTSLIVRNSAAPQVLEGGRQLVQLLLLPLLLLLLAIPAD